MDKKKSEENSVVQFNVVNTTSNTISLDLFNLATLNTTPTTLNYTFAPNSVYTSFLTSVTFPIVSLTNNGDSYFFTANSNNFQAYDSSNNLIFSTTLGVTLNSMTYNSNDNTLYIADSTTNLVYVWSVATNTLQTTIPFLNPLSILNYLIFNPTDNTVYATDFAFATLRVISCNSNTFTGVVAGATVTGSTKLTFNINQNVFYLYNASSPTVQIVDCATNTISGTYTFTATATGYFYNYLNDNLYYTDVSVIQVFSVSLNSIVATISGFPVLGNIGALDFNQNYLYVGSASNLSYVVDANTNSLITTNTFGGAGFTGAFGFDNTNNSVFFWNVPLSQFFRITTTGITATPYYVSGVINYNFFVQSLQNEPIIVSKIRVIAPQQQLQTNANILQIDSSGEQSQYPVIPILTVSAFQEQGNIADIDFDELILDGRTFVSNYLIAPNTTVILEIHYQQLDNTKIKYLLTKIMPKKVQLKDEFDKYIDLSM